MKNTKVLTFIIITMFVFTLIGCGNITKMFQKGPQQKGGGQQQIPGVTLGGSGGIDISKLPADFPKEFIYPGMVVDTSVNLGGYYLVGGNSISDQNTVINYYKTNMVAQGWNITIEQMDASGGHMIMFNKGQNANVTVVTGPPEKSGFGSHIAIQHIIAQ
jgi:hypothetical protein